MIRRLKNAERIDQVVVATTTREPDRQIIDLARSEGVEAFAGSEEDLLDRYLGAAERFKAETVVRVTGDCPLIDPKICDTVVEAYIREGADYCSNVLERSYPRGFDTEVFSIGALREAASLATEPREREHVTPFIIEHPEKFKLFGVKAEGRHARPDLRLCVDTAEDMELVREVYKRIGGSADFGLDEVLDLFDSQPELAEINREVAQKSDHLPLSFREASGGDCDLYFEWVNDPATRKSSFISELIELSTHREWFGRKLADRNCKMLLFLYNETPAGQVRFDREEDGVEIGISVAPQMRGKGIGKAMVMMAVEYIDKEWGKPKLVAYIKEENAASMEIFKKCGFKNMGQVAFKGHNPYCLERG